MSSDTLTMYFDQMEHSNQVIVRGSPRFDLEGYISNYSGRTQVDRLLHVGMHCIPLSIEALKLVVRMLKQSNDVTRYRVAVSALQKIAPEDPDAAIDEDWVQKTERMVAAETDKIEAALKSYKHNLIKESIRMGHEDLGKHYYASGDLPNAFKSYSRMRDFCTAPKHIIDMSLQIIRVCVEQRNYMAAQTHIAKIRNVARTPEEEEELKPILSAAMGIAHLASASFRDAARSFLETPPTLSNRFNDVISSNDVAVYGGLCALASMDRQSLKSEVLDNSNFRHFLELEPYMRRAIAYFHTAKYANCLQILEEYKNDYLLDIHLCRHVGRLYESIRSKGVVQYFIPFSCVTLSGMAQAFATDEQTLERELANMIERGLLQARIDTKSRLLTAKQADLRTVVHKDALEMAQNYERAARMKLLRMNIIRAGLEVKTSKRETSSLQGHEGRTASTRSGGYLERYG